MVLGVQLYTLRDHCQNLEDFAQTLTKVADMGYKTVQISGVCSYEPQWLKAQLEKNGLQAVLTHSAPDRLKGDTVQLARDHDVFGCKYVGLGCYGFNDESKTVEGFLAEYAEPARVLGENGKYFMYHNHDHEFRKIGGKLIMDLLCEGIPADLMGIIVDTYWVQAAGADPAQWLEKLSGRVPCIHLKDLGYQRKMLPVGEGNMNFDAIINQAESAGTRYLLVEQDDCNGEDPFDCLRRSYSYLHAMGLD